MDFEAKLFKVLGDQLGSACFLLAELWVLVDVPSPLDHLLLDLGSADKGLLLERVRLGDAWQANDIIARHNALIEVEGRNNLLADIVEALMVFRVDRSIG